MKSSVSFSSYESVIKGICNQCAKAVVESHSAFNEAESSVWAKDLSTAVMEELKKKVPMKYLKASVTALVIPSSSHASLNISSHLTPNDDGVCVGFAQKNSITAIVIVTLIKV